MEIGWMDVLMDREREMDMDMMLRFTSTFSFYLLLLLPMSSLRCCVVLWYGLLVCLLLYFLACSYAVTQCVDSNVDSDVCN
jgi:hypothetical protein